MSQPIRVTAVIPCHNHARWVCRAVESVAAQDHRPLRVVVVDDGSSDDSTARVMSLLTAVREPPAQGEPWAALGRYEPYGVDVMVQRFREARGPSFARNWGIRAGWDGTDVFALLDSDDEYRPGKVSRSAAKFADPRVGAVYTDFDTVRPDGARFRQCKEPFGRRRLMGECIVNCDSLVSRAALEACGLFDEEMRVCEDYDLWVRVSERFLVVHVPEPLVDVRVGPHSSTAGVPKPVWEACWRRVMEKARARAGANAG